MQPGVLCVSRGVAAPTAGEVREALAVARIGEADLQETGGLLVATWGGLRLDGTGYAALARVARRRERQLTDADVVRLLEAEDLAGLAEILPPFGAFRRISDDEAVAVTDALGFRHLYHAQWDGCAALSTSARVLGSLGGHGVDREALAVQSLLGWQVGQSTLYAGVTKLAPGHLVRLRSGRVELEDGRPAPIAPLDLDDGVAAATDMLRTHLTAYVTDHPDATLQLTGGQDSRILLSAVPPELRRGLRAMTLGVPGSPDAAIAGEIAARTGLRHQVEKLESLDGLSAEEAHALAVEASLRLEEMADPLALAALTVVEQGFDQGHRIAGLGGEVARGFYYLGPSRSTAVTRARVARLAGWRMFANEGIDPEALVSPLREAAEDVAVDRIHRLMSATGKEWLAATDDFYLEQRMQRWAGVTDTAVCTDRSVANPMLDDRFIAIAQAMSPASKRRSVFLARLQMSLDPELGRVPLDGRPPPEAFARPGLATTARAARTVSRRAVAKARQRLSSTTRPPAGGVVLARRVVEHWRRHPDLLDTAREHQVLDDAWLDRLVGGEMDPAPSTVAYVLNLSTLPPASGC
ncbi:asparagine synthase-related protein [Nocardioides sp. zg-1228]|uniref:asparagine synthase-related protein n=1 Tax=Nocardioides sp. zg-1228 TaxID=2763008 RepID=UPI001642ADCE|nr:asparagine synthase-related protein [Nocardioides sp. zg-1228]MBC2931407.1 hypothetical protein [Nocardioides sp. zg-1228]QSF57023.1 hypothetical protein JX575_15785 [Nocardioides sp. zg-1228]